MSDPVIRFFVGIFVAMNLLLTPAALLLGFEDAPWTQIVLLTPAIAALLAGYRFQLSLSDMGLQLGNPVHLLIGFGGVALYAGLTVLLGTETGFIAFEPGWSHMRFLEALLLQGLAVESLFWALGEEMGWRGLLSERLRKRAGAGVALGGVWALWFTWHLAPMLTFGATFAELACFALLLLALAAFLNSLRHRSGSVFPAVLAHTAHNQLVEEITGVATHPTSETVWTGEMGMGTAIVACLVVAGALTLSNRWSDANESGEKTC